MLQEIILDGDNHVETYSNTALVALLQVCTHFERLSPSHTTDEVLVAAAEHCRNMQHIAVATSADVTDAALAALAQHSKRLFTLHFYSCPSVTDTGVLLITTRLKCSD